MRCPRCNHRVTQLYTRVKNAQTGKVEVISNFRGYYFYYCSNCAKVIKVRT